MFSIGVLISSVVHTYATIISQHIEFHKHFGKKYLGKEILPRYFYLTFALFFFWIKK